jgi:hypothetical protein
MPPDLTIVLGRFAKENKTKLWLEINDRDMSWALPFTSGITPSGTDEGDSFLFCGEVILQTPTLLQR